MTLMTQDPTRRVIRDFAEAIAKRKHGPAKPSKEVINFRDERRQGVERFVEMVPVGLLRYRKDNGRIASDVLNYERTHGLIDEGQEEAQDLLRGFLQKKDPEKTDLLLKSVEHSGQREPAIITCDGFLINGNRRKMVFAQLQDKYRGDERFEFLKVVILPGESDPGGPPTLLEIERIENRYQLQSEGKAEYYGFDRALSIKRKVDVGFSLEEQLRDDPAFAHVSRKDLERAIREYERDYLWPLAAVDRYLRQFDRDGMYSAISTGQSDKEGRWQAFIDYSKAYATVTDEKWQIANGFPGDEVGTIEEAAFNIIRVRSLGGGLPKVHAVMRMLPRLCADRTARKELQRLADIEAALPKEECYEKDGTPLPLNEVDNKWAQHNQQTAIHRLRKATDIIDTASDTETPLSLLDAAQKKLEHPDMDIDRINVSDIPRARRLIATIRDVAADLEKRLFRNEKQSKALGRKG